MKAHDLLAWFRPNNVVSVRLMGGLGNQMFQYAAGLAVSMRAGCKLNLDTSFLRKKSDAYTVRALELDAFNVLADMDSINSLRLKSMRKISDFGGGGEHALLKLNEGGVSLRGYWQSDLYFKDVRDALLKEFTLKNPLSTPAAKLAQEIQSTDAVSVHIRRGDYVSNSSAAAVHGLCPMQYYQSAVDRVIDTVGICPIYVFSDDVAWVKANFDVGLPINVIDYPAASPAEDIHLMKLCKHHIIANSSFSWWGAWLSQRNGMKVAPQRWYADAGMRADNIAPSDWIRL